MAWTRSARNSGKAALSVPPGPPAVRAFAVFAGSNAPAWAATFGEGTRPPRMVTRREPVPTTICPRWPGVLPAVESAQSIAGARARVGKQIRAGRRGILTDAAGDRDQRGGLFLGCRGLGSLGRKQRGDQHAEPANWTLRPPSRWISGSGSIYCQACASPVQLPRCTSSNLPVQESGERVRPGMSCRTGKARSMPCRHAMYTRPLLSPRSQRAPSLLTGQAVCT